MIQDTKKVFNVPEEGKWFEVHPQAIDQKLFESPKSNWRQEKTRLLILEAFAELAKNPNKYANPFKTTMPKKNWHMLSVSDFNQISEEIGGHLADWVEQSLEWAQRIQNGESWESICNEPDTANWYRLVLWKGNHARLIGGSKEKGSYNPPSNVDKDYCSLIYDIEDTVPLVCAKI